jgi:acetyl-CoA carboxylase, biotin carboxylase subunit
MFKKILIANRGEIAIRIIRAAHELGIQTVAVYSVSDKESLHVLLSDEAVCIGPAAPSKSYLNPVALITAATLMNCDAIHPGYGFLSENADFADMIGQCGLTFIGPKTDDIKLMGDKVAARTLAIQCKVPTTPGSSGAVTSVGEAKTIAEKIGYPVLIKAAGGGGGRGMKVVPTHTEMEALFLQTKKEALHGFGNDTVYIEKFLSNPRHIEVQVLGDGNGNIRTYGLRECSIQRRHQKVLEEAPPTNLSDATKAKMIDASLQLTQSLKYVGVGTIEFLVDGDAFYFIEMNTRIQVEHPVTEMIFHIDLLKEQIQVAFARTFDNLSPQSQESGHSIECRINAEHPDTFLPSVGSINGLHFPGGPGVRVDTFIYDQYKVLPHYDSLLAKIICYDKNRLDCIKKMTRALNECIIRGIYTNIPLHLRILKHPDFIRGNYSTHFLSLLKSGQGSTHA